MLIKEEQEIFELITEYLSGAVSREQFTESYSQLLPKLESRLDGGLYHPLNVIVATEDNSERAWKENMRNMYLREIENLDSLLAEDEPSYAEKLTEQQQKELCQEALKYMPKAALDRASKEWVEDNLIEEDQFVFVDDKGNSKLGSYEILYQEKLVRRSFIMTAFSGGLPKLKFNYALLIETLKKHSPGDTVWLRCSEPDGFSAVESSPWYTDPAEETENLNWLEYTDPQSTQWGPIYLIFMSADREWLLVHANNFEEFSMTLYGAEEFLSNVLSELKSV